MPTHIVCEPWPYLDIKKIYMYLKNSLYVFISTEGNSIFEYIYEVLEFQKEIIQLHFWH